MVREVDFCLIFFGYVFFNFFFTKYSKIFISEISNHVRTRIPRIWLDPKIVYPLRGCDSLKRRFQKWAVLGEMMRMMLKSELTEGDRGTSET